MLNTSSVSVYSYKAILQPCIMKVITLGIVALCFIHATAFAYKYGEHKEIGEVAFMRFILTVQNSELAAPFISRLNIKKDSITGRYSFTDLSVEGGNTISYGVLNALSGDHENNPLLLEEQLHYKASVLESIIWLHNQYLAMGFNAAPDGKLTKMDFSYALKAAANLSHFYEYRKNFQEQLRHFDKAIVQQCALPGKVDSLFKKLNNTNAINMYVTLHTLAIDLAEQSGQLAKAGYPDAKQLLYYAFLFNAFADHFLEDAFSAGHLIVNRSVAASLTNNKNLHDFYSENGCTVINKRGEIWHAYGDGLFNNNHHGWKKTTALAQISYQPYTPEAERVITAVQLSLEDLWHAFAAAYTDERHTPFLQTIPDAKDKDQQVLFLINSIAALQLVPIPYNSDLSTLMPDTLTITPVMYQANQLLSQRNFIRSRVANSLVVGNINSFLPDHYFKGWEFRINAGNFSNRYTYNSRGGKKGTFDYWHGYTLSFATGHYKSLSDLTKNEFVQQIRAGIRSNYDFWITDRKFVGFYTYVEAGAQFINRKTTFILVHAVGFQLASLVNINYYNMPVWLRLPAQYLLPLKLKYGAIVSNQPTQYFSGFDLDILF
jgi:hypothetical protein